MYVFVSRIIMKKFSRFVQSLYGWQSSRSIAPSCFARWWNTDVKPPEISFPLSTGRCEFAKSAFMRKKQFYSARLLDTSTHGWKNPWILFTASEAKINCCVGTAAGCWLFLRRTCQFFWLTKMWCFLLLLQPCSFNHCLSMCKSMWTKLLQLSNMWSVLIFCHTPVTCKKFICYVSARIAWYKS